MQRIKPDQSSPFGISIDGIQYQSTHKVLFYNPCNVKEMEYAKEELKRGNADFILKYGWDKEAELDRSLFIKSVTPVKTFSRIELEHARTIEGIDESGSRITREIPERFVSNKIELEKTKEVRGR